MKSAKTRTLVLALLILSVASIAWAAQPTATQPTVDQPAAEAPAVQAPTADAPIVPAPIDGLFVEPTQMTGACCVADCFGAKIECKQACNFVQSCLDQCALEYQECRSHC